MGWHTFIDFLYATRRWTGSEEEYGLVHALLMAHANAAEPVPRVTVRLPALTDTEEALAFADLPRVELTGNSSPHTLT